MTDRERYTPGPEWTLILARELRHSPENVWQALIEPARWREHTSTGAPADMSKRIADMRSLYD